METIYLVLVGLLFLFAVFDLMVGVSNDAANFLNSAIGSKVTSRRNIFIVASLGILVGALFSSGMMEVARSGIFNPGEFFFAEIMVIFIAVMITDVILLDLYNTFRLPTSTTVSIVFELLGAAVAVSLFKIYQAGDGIASLINYINSEKAFAIISGILLSVIISFTVGAIVQWIVRVVFTYKYQKKLKYYGALRGGIAITAITYFLLIKGAKGSNLLPTEWIAWVSTHTVTITSIMFVGWTLILYICNKVWQINILKCIVLVGTFALAMAFAGNDLVNFIGVPIAGYNSFQMFMASGMDPSQLLMTDLAGKVPTPFYFLLIAGGVMVLTLWYSKKAQSVTETEIGLARDSVGYEGFKSSLASRKVVGSVLFTGNVLAKIFPQRMSDWISSRFEKETTSYKKDAPAFDLMRASVNLTVASVLIAIATSMKLPLSTTYVTFMVAMGTTLADGVWGRDSAVYRITGVLTVIGGWFLTAFTAFILCGIVATIIYLGGFVAVGVMVLLAVVMVYKMHVHHRKHEVKKEKQADMYSDHGNDLSMKVSYHATNVLTQAGDIFHDAINNVIVEKRSELKKLYMMTEELRDETGLMKATIHDTFKNISEEQLPVSHYYVKAIMYLRKLSRSLRDLTEGALGYVENHHPSLIESQIKELHEIDASIKTYTKTALDIVEHNQREKVEELFAMGDAYELSFETYKTAQLERIKANEVGVRNSTLFLSLIGEAENYLIYVRKMIKAYTGLHG